MGFLLDKCKLKKMDDEILSTCHPFTCGDEDLDDFFLHDAMRYKAELLGKTYFCLEFLRCPSDLCVEVEVSCLDDRSTFS